VALALLTLSRGHPLLAVAVVEVARLSAVPKEQVGLVAVVMVEDRQQAALLTPAVVEVLVTAQHPEQAAAASLS
jgi:ribosomal protein L21